VIVFQQSAHLDIDWQHTFDDYYDRWVGTLLIEARQILDAQPRAHYSITEMGFLQRHLAYHPEELEPLQRHAARGTFHIIGGGMTSPDTLLPETEMIFRDFYYGTRFSEDTLGLVPTAAWLPDSFGHAATVPDLLSAAGFTSVGFSRVDGAATFYEAIAAKTPIPFRPGSSAEAFQQLGSSDVMWQGPGGGRVFAHWISTPDLYCTGDNIDYDEDIQIPGGHLGVYNGDQPSWTDGRINQYVAALTPFAKTPYLFVPVGCDFQHPKEELLGYLDGYNQRQYPSTGVWAVAAPFDDYAALVQSHADVVPDWSSELSPYFMGFYASRAAVKRRVREAARPFWSAESIAVAVGAAAPDPAALEHLTFADHHDFVTGTAANDVVAAEQLPLLDEAEARGRAAFQKVAGTLTAKLPPASGDRLVLFNDATDPAAELIEIPWSQPVHGDLPMEMVYRKGRTWLRMLAQVPSFGWRAVDLSPGAVVPSPSVTVQIAANQVVLSNEHVQAVLAKSGSRYALSSLQIDGNEALSAPSFVVSEYADQGGLWRLGHEMANCHFTANTDGSSDQVQLLERTGLTARVALVSASGVREVRLDAGESALRLAFTARAALNTTRTVSFHFASQGPLRTSLAGGFAERVPQRDYDPTFWAAVEWLSVGPWAILLRQSTGVRLSASGDAELMAMRWAQSEQCDIEGGMGDDPDTHRFEWMVTAPSTPVAAARAAQRFNRPVAWLAAAGGDGSLAPQGSLLSVDGDGLITALKPAERGDGVIVRALLLPGPATLHLSAQLAQLGRTRTDALERDLAALEGSGDLTLDRETFGAIATVRLH
jgi:alpha-mannosidase